MYLILQPGLFEISLEHKTGCGGGVFIDKLKIKRIGFCLFGKVGLYWVAVPAGLGPPQGSGVWKKLPPAYFNL